MRFKKTKNVDISWRGYRALRKGRRLSIGVAIFLILFGILCCFPAVPAYLATVDWLNDWIDSNTLQWFCVVVGLCSLFAGSSLLRLRLLLFRSRQLIAQEDLPERLDVDEETLNLVIRKRNIRPRLILNGTRFYKRSDFGDMPLLLRPSQAPPLAEGVLLRPVPGDLAATTANLLRPAVDETRENPPTISE